MTMELSMTIAIGAAAAISEWFTALVVTLFVLLAEELEHMTVARGRLAILDLVNFVPKEAGCGAIGEVETVALSDIRPGDVVVVSPGEKVPVDGEVVAGHSYVDQSRLTANPCRRPRRWARSSSLAPSTSSGCWRSRRGRWAQIPAMDASSRPSRRRSRRALRSRSSLTSLQLPRLCRARLRPDHLADDADIRDTISVIIVAGACGIAAGTPLAILGGVGRAARMGSIIKGGLHLETLGRVDTVVFDKTGTLTVGAPVVTRPGDGAGRRRSRVAHRSGDGGTPFRAPARQRHHGRGGTRGLTVEDPESFEYIVAREFFARHSAGRSASATASSWLRPGSSCRPTKAAGGL